MDKSANSCYHGGMNKAAFDLKNWLKEHGMMQRFLAERIGVDASTMSKILTGERVPNLSRAAQIEKLTKGQVRMKDWTIPFQLEAAE